MSDTHLTLSVLPMAARLARRGRPVVHVAGEADVSPGTWDRLEKGEAVALPSLLRILGYLGLPLELTPADAKHPWAANQNGVPVQEELAGEEGDDADG
jgi:hypothetical protein